MLSAIEQTRLRVSRITEPKRKSQFGQFLTPSTIARFMAQLFPIAPGSECRLIDAGAGIGSLSNAFLEQCIDRYTNFKSIELTAFELDTIIHDELHATVSRFKKVLPLNYKIISQDFIEEAVNRIQFNYGVGYTHAILNPPYKKINSNSRHRLLLRQVGIETVNLYSAFVALTLELLAQKGLLVAIIPRSFCNGPYYKPFRDFIFERSAIRHIHLFESRNSVFKNDDVLQENIIILLERGGIQQNVIVSTSTDDAFDDLRTHSYPFNRIVLPQDSERFIHIPTSSALNIIERSESICYSLDDIGIKVSTGPVVDFRLKEFLREMPESGDVPLLYPAHFSGHIVEWPKKEIKKPNALRRNSFTEKWLYPNGFYCVVRRFSSKEEKRRIVASVVHPSTFGKNTVIGFENHLNVFHNNKQGLSETLARGLAIYLNTTGVDENFRRSSGHTQVNATDLKMMKYPSRLSLMALGEWAIQNPNPTQECIDNQLDTIS